MNSAERYVKTLQTKDFGQLIIEKEELFALSCELEAEIENEGLTHTDEDMIPTQRAYADALTQLSLLCNHMAHRTNEYVREWSWTD